MSNSPHIVVFTSGNCPFCEMAKTLLKDQGYPFNVIDVTNQPEERLKLVEKAGGQKTVPQIFIDGRHVGGYEDLKQLWQAGKL